MVEVLLICESYALAILAVIRHSTLSDRIVTTAESFSLWSCMASVAHGYTFVKAMP